ncbi:putative HTH-type transcriptional regulator [Mycolicibacterium vanbaalenii]|uniref:Putative HTH-type transcriptional regulator n=2 Tax=Mycolicibacterium vanbaalenii TaxID=110539 RepID=A0A5S9R6Y0_MYCVN|nr:putative HTH-type transcriptional regulator [Mycolicibacterium vanbaalenii]
MERIAKRAGSSKTTLYRWWPSKAAILLEAVNERPDRYPVFNDTGDVFVDLVEEIRGVIKFYFTDSGAAMLDLVADSRFDPSLAAAIRDDFIARRRSTTRLTWQRGVTRGQIRSDVDVEVVMDALWGSLYYKLLVSQDPPDVGFADQLMNTFWPAIAVGA